jgi:hypothetical protein
MRRAAYLLIALLILVPIAAAVLGHFIGAGVLHAMNLNPDRVEQTARMLAVTGATKEDFGVRARRIACSCAAGKCGPRRQRAIGCFCFTTCQTIG